MTEEARTDEGRIDAIARTMQRMRGLAEALAPEAGLSVEGAAWALDTTAASMTRQALDGAWAALRGVEGERARRHGIVLAENVFTSCLRPLAWSLLAGVPVTLKLATGDAGLAERFRDAWREEAPTLGDWVEIERFSREQPESYDALASRVEVMSVYGDDATIATLRARTPERTRFVGHGHGVGLAVIAKDAAIDARCLDALALDVAAYDQRGCLSPAAVLVEGETRARQVSVGLSAALVRVAAKLPRGPIDEATAATQAQWRGVSASLFELFEGASHAVSYEGDGAIRPTPGGRHVAVHVLPDLRTLPARVALYGEHLKALGTAGAVHVPATVSPVVSRLGEMQRPTLSAWMDGLAPWTGLIDED